MASMSLAMPPRWRGIAGRGSPHDPLGPLGLGPARPAGGGDGAVSYDPGFGARIVLDPLTGCWLWHGTRAGHYGLYKHELAHRWAYKHFTGPIPAGYQVDHLCHRRTCVNPAHLEAVTQQK